jgi:hypothetical protein
MLDINFVITDDNFIILKYNKRSYYNHLKLFTIKESFFKELNDLLLFLYLQFVMILLILYDKSNRK